MLKSADDQDLPVYLETMAYMQDRMEESPWSPEALEPRIIAEDAKPAMPMRHMLALVTPTQVMEVIPSGQPG